MSRSWPLFILACVAPLGVCERVCVSFFVPRSLVFGYTHAFCVVVVAVECPQRDNEIASLSLHAVCVGCVSVCPETGRLL